MNMLRTRDTRSPYPAALAEAFEPLSLVRNFLRWDPFQDASPGSQGTSTFLPSFDVKETADAYHFTADMPGIRREDLDIQMAGNRLSISGRREAEPRKEDERWYALERSFGTFNRTFSLPEEVEAGKVVAELRDGVLHLMVPKSPGVRPQKIVITGN